MSELPLAVQANLPLAQGILARCDQLATCSSLPAGICRTYLSREHRLANDLVGQWCTQAGLDTWIDAAGSICARLPGPRADARALVIGSHLDSIPDAGRYDGVLGVLLGIAVAQELRVRGETLPFALEIIGFGEEEGVRFGTTLMSSRAFAGTWDPNWWSLTDAAGMPLAQAFADFGLEAHNIAQASRAAAAPLAYLEVHIEQGPVLESLELPLGVVTAIAGARRLRIAITGTAGHAGTTPMALRRDALVLAARGITLAEELAIKHGAVATVGQIDCAPGAVNVIPGQVEFSLDVRSGDDTVRDALIDDLSAQLATLCAARGAMVQIDQTHSATAVPCAPALQELFAHSIAELGSTAHRLESGAGHDAMAVADICDVGMLFVRCTGGISHNPAEAVTEGDVAWAFTALYNSVLAFARDHR